MSTDCTDSEDSFLSVWIVFTTQPTSEHSQSIDVLKENLLYDARTLQQVLKVLVNCC